MLKSLAISLVLLAGLGQPAYAQQAAQHCRPPYDRNALWKRSSICVSTHDADCGFIDQANEFIILQDECKPASYLIIPTFRAKGIEDLQALERPAVANLWKYGWEKATKDYVKKSPDETGMAINSVLGRTQDQLHIHLACVKESVQKMLKTATIPTTWKINALKLEGHQYNAIAVKSLDRSPFLILQDNPFAAHHMADQSLAVIGAPGGGFYLLNSHSAHGVKARAEELLQEDKCPW